MKEICKKIETQIKEDLEGKDIGWKIEYAVGLHSFCEFILDRRYFIKEIAEAGLLHLENQKLKIQIKRRKKELPGFDGASKRAKEILQDSLDNRITPNELAKIILKQIKAIQEEEFEYASLIKDLS